MGGSSAGSSGSADAPTTTRSTVTQVREKKSILDYSPTFQIAKAVVNTVKNVFNKNNPRSNRNDPTGLYAEGLTTGSRNNINMGGGDNNNSATNVGGKIVKLAPTSAEISQSKATDVTYDSRKTKARGRSMTILTSAKGIGRNMGSVLGSKSLLGA